MDTEVLAVNAVKESLALTEFLKAYGGNFWLDGNKINDGEKMPSWDGDIIIYEKGKFDKHNTRKIPVQVKGLKKDNLSKQNISYSISKVDLYNYCNDGGVIYFVVYINKEREKRIYYRELLPIYIRDILKTSSTNKSISIKFKIFPKRNEEKLSICCEFWMNRKKQFSFTDLPLPTFSDLKDNPNFEYFIPIFGTKNLRTLNYELLSRKELFVYAINKKEKTYAPLAEMIRIKQIREKKVLPIKVNEEVFYDEFIIIKDTEFTTIKIGSVLQIKTPNSNPTKLTININIQGTLKQRIKGMKFLSAAINNKSFYVGDVLIDCVPENGKDKDAEILNLNINEKLYGLEEFQKVLDTMGVKEDLEMDNLTDKDIDKMNALIACINKNNFLSNKPKNLPFQGRMKIGNLSLALICIGNAQNETEYKFFNAFDRNLNAFHFDNNNTEKKFPVCCTLKRDNFLCDNNINYEFIISIIKEYEVNDLLLQMTNNLILQMLLAYDLNGKEDLYSALQTLAQYVYGNNDFDKDISKINLLQIKQRKQKLSSSDLKELNEICERTDDKTIKIACLILLKSYELAQVLLNELPEKEQQNITSYPIYNLLKKEKHNG